MYKAVWSKGNIRIKYIFEILVSISLIGYILDEIKDIKCVSNKKIESAFSILTDVNILVQGWKKSEESKKNS